MEISATAVDGSDAFQTEAVSYTHLDVYKRQVDSLIGDDQDKADWDLIGLNESLLRTIPLKPITPERIEDKKNKNELKHMLKAVSYTHLAGF